MKPVEIKKDIYWVGGIDWDLRNFHGYITQRGSTYNAYLIIDEKITLVDAVKYYLYDEMMERISCIIDPSKIDYIVSNHVEMDHSGTLPNLKKIAKDAEVITSPNGEKGLKLHYRDELNTRTVQSGETLNLGKRNLQFLLYPMVHWPDSMGCYMPEEKLLIPNDAFGQHLATAERFDDEYQIDIIMHEAKKYYANIVLPYSSQVKKVLEAVAPMDIEMIAPSHGLIWRSHIPTIVEAYSKWSANETENKALIIYDTMWNTTKKIAHAIADGFENKNIKATLIDLKYTHISDIMTEVMTSKFICVGSPTLNNNILPTVAAFLTYFKGLAPKGRTGFAFGSYGWSGQSVGIIESHLKDCGMNIMDMVRIQYIPEESALKEITKQVESSL